jgi:hypothetical protein
MEKMFQKRFVDVSLSLQEAPAYGKAVTFPDGIPLCLDPGCQSETEI